MPPVIPRASIYALAFSSKASEFSLYRRFHASSSSFVITSPPGEDSANILSNSLSRGVIYCCERRRSNCFLTAFSRNSSICSSRPVRPSSVSLNASTHADTKSSAADLILDLEPKPPRVSVKFSSNSLRLSFASAIASLRSLISLSYFFSPFFLALYNAIEASAFAMVSSRFLRASLL